MHKKNLSSFSIKYIIRKMKSINVKINLENQTTFPKSKQRLISFYSYQFRFIRFHPNGYFNRSRFISSLIDFSFIRSLVADCYSSVGGHCYDPCSLFLLDLFRWLDEFPSLAIFCNNLNDIHAGKHYRLYAGINDSNIPCEADFSNFRKRIGYQKYQAIFDILIQIAQLLNLITARILSHDGTLVPSFANYKGCNYSCNQCYSIRLKDNFIQYLRNRILTLIQNPHSYDFNKEHRAFAKCPRTHLLPDDVKPPSFHVCNFKIAPYDKDKFNPHEQISKLLGLSNILKQKKLMLIPLNSNISKIELNLKDNPVFVKCPRIPADGHAKIGYKRSKHNPNKKVKVFGYIITISTSIEPETGLELPIACICDPASHKDGHHFIPLKEHIKNNHPKLKTFIDIADAGFDYTQNYIYSRNHGSIPFFDYNTRGENLSQDALYKRRYDKHGTPYAPCNASLSNNGYDNSVKELVFVCNKICLKDPSLCPDLIKNCSHLNKSCGFSIHIPISKNPRLFNEVPRNTKRYFKIRSLRSSSERTNSTAKSDLNILNHPYILNLLRAKIFAHLTVIVILLKRVLSFIARITLTLWKAKQSHKKKYFKELQLHFVHPAIFNIIKQRE